jgi:hypothetical protein
MHGCSPGHGADLQAVSTCFFRVAWLYRFDPWLIVLALAPLVNFAVT